MISIKIPDPFLLSARARSLPRAILNAHDQLVEAAWTAKRHSPFKSSHTAAAVTAIAQLSAQALEQPEYFQGYSRVRREERGTGMFGDPEANAAVEKAATDRVRKFYEREGWTVRSREADGCGYDLECQRGRSLRHVEVKGRSGADIAFILTSLELDVASKDPHFQLAVVTEACSERAQLQFFDGKAFEAGFVVRPIRFVARRVQSPDAS